MPLPFNDIANAVQTNFVTSPELGNAFGNVAGASFEQTAPTHGPHHSGPHHSM